MHVCVELVPWDGTIFSTCTLCDRYGIHTERLGGKWSYCAARVGFAKQGMKTADLLPLATIRSVPLLAQSHGAEAQSSREWRRQLCCLTKLTALQTWVLSHTHTHTKGHQSG